MIEHNGVKPNKANNKTPPQAKSVLEVISDISGVGKKEVNSIFEKVKQNHRKLDNCKTPHEFEPHERIGGEESKIYRNYKCKKCGGILDSINVSWYERGLKDGSI